MGKISKLLVIAVAFALVISMIPSMGSYAFAEVADEQQVPEISSLDFTVKAPICGDLIGMGEEPSPKAPEFGLKWGASRNGEVEPNQPDVTIPDDALYTIEYIGWLIEDPEGYHGYNDMWDTVTAHGGEKYYIGVRFVAGVHDGMNDDYTLSEAYFADDAVINVTGGKLVWSEFIPYESPWRIEEAVTEDEPAEEAVEEATDDAAVEELVEEAVEEPVTEVTDEPLKAHENNYYAGIAVIEVGAEHVPGDKVIENRVEPTATADGHYDEVIYCEKCQEELSRVTIPIPHTEPGDNTNNNNNGVPKTADETGLFTWMLILALAAAACIRIKAGSRE